MLRAIHGIVVKELQVLLRDRAALALLFVIPVMFILVMTPAMRGIFGADKSGTPARLLVVDEDDGAVSRLVVADLGAIEGLALVVERDGRRLDRARAEEIIEAGEIPAALLLPQGFSEAALASVPEALFITDPAAPAQLLAPIRGMVEGFVERRVALAQAPARARAALEAAARALPPEQARALASVIESYAGALGARGAAALEGPRFALTPTAPARYARKQTPTSVQQNVPAFTVFGIFFIAHALAGGVLRERQDGTARRLHAAPVSRLAQMIGKVVPYFAVSLVQVVLMFGTGALVFGMQLGGEPLALLLVTLASAASATGLGLLVANLARTAEQVGGLSLLLLVTLAALGGTMVPAYVMPGAMQTLSRVSPHAWALEGYQDVLVRGLGVGDVLPEVGVLSAFAFVFLLVAHLRFRSE